MGYHFFFADFAHAIVIEIYWVAYSVTPNADWIAFVHVLLSFITEEFIGIEAAFVIRVVGHYCTVLYGSTVKLAVFNYESTVL